MKYLNITRGTKNDFVRLLVIWESAVKATHDFLAHEDFMYYQSRMTDYFGQVDLYVCKDENGETAGFMGVSGSMLEMLFVDAAFRGCGVGRKLLRYAIDKLDVRKLDVNEQNSQAVGFYTHMGFQITGRSPLDNEGKPYPLLHLQYMMNNSFKIRAARRSDAGELRDLFRNTVLAVNRRDYSQEEVEDWASCGNDISRIEDMINAHYFLIAVNPESQIVGFSSITPQGYLHNMFVHKDFQGMGVATLLLNETERYAEVAGIKRMTSEVSLIARPFFEKRGFVVEKEQKRKACKLFLTNFGMTKQFIF